MPGICGPDRHRPGAGARTRISWSSRASARLPVRRASSRRPGPTIRRALSEGLPCLGICLGMQLLFDASDEGPGAGIGFFAGRVRRVNAALVPHMGWNTLEDTTDPLAGHVRTHRWHTTRTVLPARPPTAARRRHGRSSMATAFPAIVRRQRTLGVQFHPEKSSAPGVRFIHAVPRRTPRPTRAAR